MSVKDENFPRAQGVLRGFAWFRLKYNDRIHTTEVTPNGKAYVGGYAPPTTLCQVGEIL